MPKLPRRLRLCLCLQLGRLHLDHHLLRLSRAILRACIDARGVGERRDGDELSTLPGLELVALVDNGDGETVDARDDEVSETTCGPGVDISDEEENADDVGGSVEGPFVEQVVVRASLVRLTRARIWSGMQELLSEMHPFRSQPPPRNWRL